jgi:ribosomal protein S18 acetylase RimI-like enzyme
MSMKVRSLGYQTDLALLQLGGSEIEDFGNHLVVRSPHNPHHWWGNFLLLDDVPAPDNCQHWIDRFEEVFPGATHRAIGFDGVDGRVDDLEWFIAQGFEAEVQSVMTASHVQAPAHRNSNATYRQLHSESDWAQSVELGIRCNERQLEPRQYRQFRSAQVASRRHLQQSARGAWFGALVDGRLVSQMGLISARPDLARFQSVETEPNLRRQGLASSLLHFVSTFGFDELGADTLVMVADPNYFAIDLYRSVGFTDTEAQLQIELSPPSM